MIRTCGLRIRRSDETVASVHTNSQPAGIPTAETPTECTGSHDLTPFREKSATRLLPDFSDSGGPEHSFQGGIERLLNVREVAARLGVCTASVRAMCERGELRHLRVMNRIRVRVQDLADFIASRVK